MLPVINTPRVSKKKKKNPIHVSGNISDGRGERHLCAVGGSSGCSTLGSVIVESGLIQMHILSCCSPVQGQLFLRFLLFIKSRQLSHNFTLRLMENLSVEFMVFFGQLLN